MVKEQCIFESKSREVLLQRRVYAQAAPPEYLLGRDQENTFHCVLLYSLLVFCSSSVIKSISNDIALSRPFSKGSGRTPTGVPLGS
jgi:hypothetical protein